MEAFGWSRVRLDKQGIVWDLCREVAQSARIGGEDGRPDGDEWVEFESLAEFLGRTVEGVQEQGGEVVSPQDLEKQLPAAGAVQDNGPRQVSGEVDLGFEGGQLSG